MKIMSQLAFAVEVIDEHVFNLNPTTFNLDI